MPIRIAFVDDNYVRWEEFTRESRIDNAEMKRLEEERLTRWESYIDLYAFYLSAHGFECRKYVPSRMVSEPVATRHQLGHTVVRVPVIGKTKSGFTNGISFNCNLRKLFRKDHPDIIHYNTYYSSYFLFSGIHAASSRIVTQYTGGEPPRNASFVETLRWLIPVRVALKNAKGVIVSELSELERRQSRILSSYYHVNSKKLFACPVVIFDEKVFYERDRLKSAEALGFRRDLTNILVVSGMTKSNSKTDLTKNPLFFIDILQELRGTNENWHAHFVGFGPALSEAQRKVKELRLDDMITLHGFVDHRELPAYYSASDLVVYPLPAHDLNSGTAVNEAFACRRPVVSYKRAPEFSTEQEGGFLIDVNVSDAARELDSIITGTDRLAKKGVEGFRMSQRFRIETVGERLRNIYLAML